MHFDCRLLALIARFLALLPLCLALDPVMATSFIGGDVPRRQWDLLNVRDAFLRLRLGGYRAGGQT